jgi:flagellin
MNSQIRGMTVATRNANDGVSMAQTSEASMGVMTETMQRMRDLAVQASNSGAVTSEDKEKLQTENRCRYFYVIYGTNSKY